MSIQLSNYPNFKYYPVVQLNHHEFSTPLINLDFVISFQF